MPYTLVFNNIEEEFTASRLGNSRNIRLPFQEGNTLLPCFGNSVLIYFRIILQIINLINTELFKASISNLLLLLILL
jgi:hypothetical protein